MLVSKNIYINKRRTSMRLDPESWKTLADICKTEKTSISKLLSLIDTHKGDIGLSVATRVFIISYLRYTIEDLKNNTASKISHREQILRLISVIYKKQS